MNTSTKSAPDLVALLTIIIWGTNFVFQKALLAELNPWAYLWVRYAGMLALGWGIVAWQRRAAPRGALIQRVDLPRFALAGVVGYLFYIGLSTYGLSYTTAFSSALLIATSPLFTAILLLLLRLEVVSRTQFAGMLVAFAGIAVFVSEKIQAGLGGAGYGDLISLLSVIGWAAYNVINKPLLAKYPSAVITTVCLSFGAAPLLVVALPTMLQQNWTALSTSTWLALGWSIVGPVWLAWTLWSWVNAKRGVARTSLFMYLVPVVGGLASWWLLGETFSTLKLAGAGIASLGIILSRLRPVSKPRANAFPRPTPAAETAA